ncbi:hypothetical protein NDU88_006473 [Pleurodeles waltl]|uniref:Uncharacterized protein n=1 Tax=Pleurodeles waltl TaxID=8319 RepID=A0AAV7PL51_PLEWA|nr:hypothetical protein NDU88_006473 [Pleurodeles waltl]
MPAALLQREARQLDAAGRRMFASCSASLRSINTSCVLARFSHPLWDCVKSLPSLPEDALTALTPLIRDGQQFARITVRAGMDTTDSVGRLMAVSVAIHRRGWLVPSNFSATVQDALLDMLFDGKSLFGAHADSALRCFRDSHGRD